MGTAFPTGLPEEQSGKQRKLRRQALAPVIASAYGWWAARLGLRLGPGLGIITERFDDLDLSKAWPKDRPPQELIDPRAIEFAYDSGPTEVLRNANAWAAAL